MKRKIRIVSLLLILMIIIVGWAYYDLQKDSETLYIPGRDTLKYWNEGVCDIIGEAGNNSLRVNKQCITSYDDFVAAYKLVGDEVFFITEKEKFVINLETAAYVTYHDGDFMDTQYAAEFSDENSFVWLSAI